MALKHQFYDLNEFFVCDFDSAVYNVLLTYFKSCNVNNWLYKIKINFELEALSLHPCKVPDYPVPCFVTKRYHCN